MESREFKKKLLDEKIKKFKETVRNSAIQLGVKQPIVKIWECPYQKEDEIAHCHIETGEICISEQRLEQASMDEIINTATHETAHLKYADHSPSFHSTHQNVKSSTWEPPRGGVMSFSEADLKGPTEKSKPSKPDKKHCNYWREHKHKKGKLTQCRYCKGYFCDLHITPRPAGLIDYKDYNKFSSSLQNEIKNPNSHPCISYNTHFEKKGKEQEEKWSRTLDILTGHSKSHKKSNALKGERKSEYILTLPKKEIEDYEQDGEWNQTEMYSPSKNNFRRGFKNPLKNLFSFTLHHEIKEALVQFSIALSIGLVLNYIYYQNLSLRYLFIGGVQDWFNILMGLLNYGAGGSYDILYLIINGLFYFYLYSMSFRLASATIASLNKKGTITFLIEIAVLLFVIFKYFPSIIY